MAVHLVIFLILCVTTKLINGDCRKTFIYHPIYNYGYDIFCTRTNSAELSTTMAKNEISLTIQDSNLTITPTTFKYLGKLRQLNITSSHLLTENPQSNATGKSGEISTILSSLTRLETLIIQRTTLPAKDMYFSGMSKLKKLILEGNALENLPNNSFNNLTNLQMLSMKDNKIPLISAVPLCSLRNLRVLDLSNNSIQTLNNSDIQCVSRLETLNLNYNQVTKLHGVESKSLTKLSLRANRIDCIQTFNVSNLTILDLSQNQLSNITHDDFSRLIHLEQLDLSRNNLTKAKLDNPMMKQLDLSHNNLSEMPQLKMTNLQMLNLSFNQLASIKALNISGLQFLEILELERNKLSHLDIDFSKLKKLKTLNLSGNKLSNFPVNIDKSLELVTLNMSHNKIEKLSTKLFNNSMKLKSLDFAYNQIKYLNQSTFENLENLEVLNMSNNLLSELDYKLLEPLENLIILDVDSNMIKDFDYGSIVSELPNLDAFKVKNNLLTCAFLTKMLHYFKDNEITFSLNEQLNFDEENVAGIYCKETEDKLLHLEETEEALKNNTKVLDKLYSLYNDKAVSMVMQQSQSYSLTTGEIITCILSLVSIVVLLTLAAQKALVWHRRRSYLVDELELITNEPYKRLG